MELPSVWYCEACKHRGLESAFRTKDGDSTCPKCNSEDIFPTRWFRCNKCDEKYEQDQFFVHELGKDRHPITELKLEPVCPNEHCPSHENEDFDNPNPTTVTEIPVPGIAA